MTDVAGRLATALSDRYQIERELGAGGMATVYLAHDVRHDRKVALKVLRPELAAILGGERFLAEIKTTANLQHPHILSLFDSGEADGTVFYVMPYVDGESLRDRLNREKQLPVDEAVRLTREVADALSYAHGLGIVHRDIKPENILLQGGHALVADFGIALAAARSDGGARMTETGMSLGTPHYMAPEQAMGEREITPKADVYALGCVLYEMLTGEPPFTGPTAQAIIARVMTEEPRSLTLQRRTVPPHVEAAVTAALAKLPADRFASAELFAQALSRADAALPATRAQVAARPPRRVAQRALAAAPWAVAALGLVAGAAGWLRRQDGGAAGPVRFYHVTDSTHGFTSICCGPPLAIAPDGRTIAYEGVGRRVTVFVRRIDELHGRVLTGTEGARNLFFSPDGAWVGYVVGSSLMKVPAAGGAPVTVLETGTIVTGATWTADNQIVFGRFDSTGLFTVGADGGLQRRLTTPDTSAGQFTHAWPHYVAGADALLFAVFPRAANPATARIGLLRRRDGRLRIVSAGSTPQYAAGHLLTLRDGGVLLAQRFDPASGDTSGPPERLADGIVTRAGALGEYAASRTGTLVYPQGSSTTGMALMREGGATSRVEVHLAQVSHFDSPRFSPDGRFILFAGYHDQESRHVGYVLDPARGSTLRITFGGDTEFLDWTPDGRRIVYRKGDTLAARRSDRGGEEEILLAPTGDRPAIGRVSVGGGWLAFHVRKSGQSDIWALPPGDSARPYLATPFQEFAATLTADGRWVAYVSDETGRNEVYVSSFPEAGARATVSVDGGTEPQWSRDRRTLYFVDTAGELVAARLRLEAAGAVVESRRTVLRGSFERSGAGAEFDSHPRSGAFVVFDAGSGAGARLIVTLNAVREP